MVSYDKELVKVPNWRLLVGGFDSKINETKFN